MKYTFILVVVLGGCNINKPDNSNIIAFVNNIKITTNAVDSIVQYEIYKLRKNALNDSINSFLLKNEASNKKTTIKFLLRAEIYDKVKNQSNNDYLNERYNKYIDSLRAKNSIKVLLIPSSFRKIDLSCIHSHNRGNLNSKVSLYIISDYDCSICQKLETKLKYFYKKYNTKISFKYVCYSDHLNFKILLSEAASNQGKFWILHDYIYSMSDKSFQEQDVINFASQSNIDTFKLKEDVNKNNILIQFGNNKKQLERKGIYTVPTLVLNNKLIGNQDAMDYLETIIEKEISN